MRYLLKRYQESDPAVRSSIEVLFFYPGIKALLLYRLSSYLWHGGFKFLARGVADFSRFVTGIEIHPGAKIGRGLVIDHGMGIVVGETAVIGDDCLLYHGVTLGATKNLRSKRHPTLGTGVIVGAGAKILGDITIGDGAKIGANSVVLRDVPPGATALGIPARLVQEVEPD
jgi:serine O-acetyltransferase